MPNASRQCGWPGCTVLVDVQHWGCKEHWMKVPGRLRQALQAAERPRHPLVTPAWHEAAKAVNAWVEAYRAAAVTLTPPRGS